MSDQYPTPLSPTPISPDTPGAVGWTVAQPPVVELNVAPINPGAADPTGSSSAGHRSPAARTVSATAALVASGCLVAAGLTDLIAQCTTGPPALSWAA